MTLRRRLIRAQRRRELYKQVSKAFGRVALRRMRQGPKRPSWSYRYEGFIELLRIQFSETHDRDLARMRRNFDRIGDQEDKRNRSQTEWTEVAGMKAAWVRPLHFEPEEGVVLYLHGGGYVVGSPRSHRGIMSSIAVNASVRVLGIDYRLAPENPCPAAIEDAVRAYRWLIERYDPSEIVIAGDSAGGGLTAATLIALRDEGLPMPAGGVLISAWLDLAPTDQKDTGYDYILPDEGNHWSNAYAATLGWEDPRVSPVRADLHDLPPLFVIAGEVELLADQSVRFAERAREAGVDVHLHVEPDEVHVYPAFFDLSASAQVGLGRIAHFIRWAYGYAHGREDAV